MVKPLFLIVLLLLQSIALSWAGDGDPSTSGKAPVVGVQGHETAGARGEKIVVEAEAIAPRTAQEDRAAVEYLAREINKAPNAQVQIVQLTEEADVRSAREQEQLTRQLIQAAERSASAPRDIHVTKAKAPPALRQQMEQRFQGAREFLVRHERVSLSILRASVNGTIVSIGLVVNTGLPAVVAVPIGLVGGTLSGLSQYFNPQLQKLLVGDVEKNRALESQGRVGKFKVKTYQLAKWLAIEASFLGLINGFSAAIGAPNEGLLQELVKIARSSLMSTASQGVWDATIANETRDRLDRTTDEAVRGRIQMRSNIITFGVSMASVFGAVLSMMGTPMGTWVLAGLGATGILYSAKKWLVRPRHAVAGSMRLATPKLAGDCRGIFL